MAPLFGTRAQIGRIDPEITKPAPIGSSQFFQAPKRSGVGRNAMALADSLSKLSNSLSRYGSVANADPDRLEIDEATQKMYGMTPEERDAYQRSAEFLALDKTIQAAGYSISGSASATEWATQIAAEFASPNYGGSFDDKVADMQARRQAHMDTLGTDAERAAFWRGSQSFVDRFTAGEQTKLIGGALQNRDDAVFSHIMGRTTDSIHEGLPTNEVADYVISELEAMPGFVKMDPWAQQDLLFRVAKAYAAEGRPELVKSLLSKDRGDVGPLIDLPKYKVDGMVLIEKATEIRDKENFDVTMPAWLDITGKAKRAQATDPVIDDWIKKNGPLSPAKERSLRTLQQNAVIAAERTQATADHRAATTSLQNVAKMDNVMDGIEKWTTNEWHKLDGYWTVDNSGNPKFIEREAQLKEINTAIMGMIDSDDGLSPEAKTETKLRFAEDTGQVVGQFKALLEAGVVQSTPDKLQGDQPLKAASEALDLYMDMHSRDTSTVERHLKGNKRGIEFYEAARIFRSSGLNDNDALGAAYQIVQKLDPTRNSLQIEDIEVIVEGINELGDVASWWRLDLPNDEDPKNTQQVAVLVKDMVNLYIRAGLGKDAAIKEAVDGLEDRFSLINGYLVATWDGSIPKDFPDLAKSKLDQYFADHAEEDDIESPENLYLVQVGESPVVFQIWNAESGTPAEDHADRFITLGSLPHIRKRIEDDQFDAIQTERKKLLAKELAKREEDERNVVAP